MQQVLIALHRVGPPSSVIFTPAAQSGAGGPGGWPLRDRMQIHGPAFRHAHPREIQELGKQPREPVAFAHDQIREKFLVGIGAR